MTTNPYDPDFGWKSQTLVISVTASMVAYVGYGLLFEQFVMPILLPAGQPRLSYGQQAGMIMLPLAGLLGAGAGSTLILQRRWQRSLTIAIPIIVAIAVAGIWKNQFARYGSDPSDWVLYIPLLAGSAFYFVWSVMFTLLG